MQKKKCKYCNIEKPLNEFYKQNGGKYGVRSLCIECCKKYYKILRSKEENKLKAKIYREEHKEEMRIYHKKNYLENKELISQRNKNWRIKNKKKKAESDRNYQLKNSEKLRLYRKEYRENQLNRDRINKQRNKQRNENFYIKLNHKMGASIRKALKSNKNGRHWESLVGYTLEDLKKHLESQFQEGMTWENYGKWHIDHIIPISLFNINGIKSKGFKKCWSLENLRPLWAKENMKKHNNILT